MAAKKAKNETETLKANKITILLDDDSEDFPDNNGDETAQDAEIISETKFQTAQREELVPDEFSQFLANLPPDSDIKLIITRLADRNLAGQFRLFCNNDEHSDTIYWNGETDPSEIYAAIVKKHGGGRYRIQTRGKTGFQSESRTVTLADGAERSEKEKLALEEKTKKEEQERKTDNSQSFAFQAQPPPVPPKAGIDELIEQISKIETLKTLLAPPPPATTAEPATNANEPLTKDRIKLLLLEKSLDNPKLLEKALLTVFDIPPEKAAKENTGFWAQLIETVVTDPVVMQKLVGTATDAASLLATPIFNMFAPKPPQATNPANGLDAFKRPESNPPPATNPINEPQPPAAAQNEQVFTPQAPAKFIQLED